MAEDDLLGTRAAELERQSQEISSKVKVSFSYYENI